MGGDRHVGTGYLGATLVASYPNYQVWLLMEILDRHIRSFSFRNIPFMEDCSLFNKFQRKVGQCKGGCINLIIITIMYTHILLI